MNRTALLGSIGWAPDVLDVLQREALAKELREVRAKFHTDKARAAKRAMRALKKKKK